MTNEGQDMEDFDITNISRKGSVATLYSPTQLAVATVLGGPLAAVYFLRANYVSLEEFQRARVVTVWGVLICIAVLLLVIFLPPQLLPEYLIPFLCAGAAYQIAIKTMPSKSDIQNDDILRQQSNWRVLWLSILLCILYSVLLGVAAYLAVNW